MITPPLPKNYKNSWLLKTKISKYINIPIQPSLTLFILNHPLCRQLKSSRDSPYFLMRFCRNAERAREYRLFGQLLQNIVDVSKKRQLSLFVESHIPPLSLQFKAPHRPFERQACIELVGSMIELRKKRYIRHQRGHLTKGGSGKVY
jgi:hypothetical protein